MKILEDFTEKKLRAGGVYFPQPRHPSSIRLYRDWQRFLIPDIKETEAGIIPVSVMTRKGRKALKVSSLDNLDFYGIIHTVRQGFQQMTQLTCHFLN